MWVTFAYTICSVGNAVLSVPKRFWGFDAHKIVPSYGYVDPIVPLRGRNAGDSVPYGFIPRWPSFLPSFS